MKTTLTPEESQRLIALGVDPDLASATRYTISETEEYCGYKREITVTYGYIDNYLSANSIFTLTDILSILPKEIEIDGKKENLNIVMDNFGALVGYPKFHEKHGCAFVTPELIDALYQLLIWAIEKGYVKTNKDN